MEDGGWTLDIGHYSWRRIEKWVNIPTWPGEDLIAHTDNRRPCVEVTITPGTKTLPFTSLIILTVLIEEASYSMILRSSNQLSELLGTSHNFKYHHITWGKHHSTFNLRSSCLISDQPVLSTSHPNQSSQPRWPEVTSQPASLDLRLGQARQMEFQ